MSDFSFILVNPQLAANVGSCARAIANFGFSDLRIVSSFSGLPEDEVAIALSCRGADVLKSAKVFGTLNDAVSDLKYIYAVSARERALNKPCINSQDIKILPKTGFMFGCESSGLSNEDVSIADALLQIETAPLCSSINLSHAVCLVAYEVYNKSVYKRPEICTQNYDVAERQDVLMMLNELESILDASGFFRVQEQKKKMIINLRSSVMRASLSEQEVKTFRGIIKSCMRLSRIKID